MASKVARFVERLYQKTTSNEIQWDRTEEEGVFQYAFPDYAVRISEYRGSEVTPDRYLLTIYNESGELIEEVTHYEAETAGTDGAYGKMQSTYETARRQAMGIEKALNDLLSYLGDEEEDFDDIPF